MSTPVGITAISTYFPDGYQTSAEIAAAAGIPVEVIEAKFGLRGYSEALDRELAGSHVRVLHVAPRATRTAFNDTRVRALNDVLRQAEDAPEVVRAAVRNANRPEPGGVGAVGGERGA